MATRRWLRGKRLRRAAGPLAALLLVVVATLAVPQAAQAESSAAATVRIAAGGTLDPGMLEVTGRTVVTWVNLDNVSHRVLSDASGTDGRPLFDSGTVRPGYEYTHRFDTLGTFAYRLGTSTSWSSWYSSWSWRAAGTVAVRAAAVTPATPTPTPPAPAPGAVMVEIGDNYFNPASLSVPVGTTVTWMNHGSRKHTATAAGGAFDSGILAAGASFSFTFGAPGSYAYVCELHSGQSGAIEVTGSAAGATPTPTPTPTRTPTPPAPAPGATTVEIGDNYFSPASLSVPVGTTVTWVNRGSFKHTATATGVFDSGILAVGASFSFTFGAPGSYPYVCELHSGQSGTVTVTGSAAAGVTPTPTPAPTPAPASAAAAAPGAVTVEIGDNYFSPASLSVQVGTTVTWVNRGRLKHTATAAGGAFDSGILAPGASFSFTFRAIGSYAYVCELHPGQAGSIEVQATAVAGAVSSPATPTTPAEATPAELARGQGGTQPALIGGPDLPPLVAAGALGALGGGLLTLLARTLLVRRRSAS